MPRALTEKDATILKLTLFALIERYSTFERAEIESMYESMPTPSDPTDDTMEAIGRVRIDGRIVVRRTYKTRERERQHTLEYPFNANSFPGGARTVCLALTTRMYELLGMPVTDDDRNERTQEAIDWNTVDRLAASIEIIEPAETLH